MAERKGRMRPSAQELDAIKGQSSRRSRETARRQAAREVSIHAGATGSVAGGKGQTVP